MTFPAPPPTGQPAPPGLPVESRDAIEAALLRRAPEIARTAPDDPGRRLMLDCAVNDVLFALLPHLEAFADAVRDHERDRHQQADQGAVARVRRKLDDLFAGELAHRSRDFGRGVAQAAREIRTALNGDTP